MKKKILIVTAVVLLIVPVVLYHLFPENVCDMMISIERHSAQLSEKKMQVGTHTVAWLEGGHGETILFLHGFSTNKDNWTRLSKFLTPDYRVIAIDIPGFGNSSRIENEIYDIASQVKRLKAISDALNLDRFHIAGHSMGGEIAGKFAIDYPDKVLSLTLVATAGVPTTVKSKLTKRLENGENPFNVTTMEAFERFLEFEFVTVPWIPGVIKEKLLAESIKYADFNTKILNESHIHDTYDFRENLCRIKNKTLVIWGDHDPNQHVSCTDILKTELVDSSVYIMKDCGHLPMVERPEETSLYFLSFLKKVKKS